MLLKSGLKNQRKMLLSIIILSTLLLHASSSSLEKPKVKEMELFGPEEEFMIEFKDNLNRNPVLQKCGWYASDLAPDLNRNPQDLKLPDEVDQDGNTNQYLWKPPKEVQKAYNDTELNFFLFPSQINWCETESVKIVQRTNDTMHKLGTSRIDPGSDVEIVANITLLGNGSLTWTDVKGLQQYRHPKDFCVNDTPGMTQGFEICQLNCTNEIPCGHNCCLPKNPGSDTSSDLTVVPQTSEVPKAASEYLILQKCQWFPQSSSFGDDEGQQGPDNQDIPYFWNPPDELLKGYGGTEWKLSLGQTQRNWCATNKVFKIVHTSRTDMFPQQYDMKGYLPDVRFVDNMTLSRSGTLTWVDIQGVQHFRTRLNFCVTDSPVDALSYSCEFQICQSNSTKEVPRVSKCCPENHVIDAENRRCISTETLYRPTFYRNGKKDNTNHPYSLGIGLPVCKRTYLIQSNFDNKFPNLLTNGTLYLVNGVKTRTRIQPGEYCIDGVYSSVSLSNGTVVTYSGSEWDQAIIGCSPDELEIPSWIPPLYATVNHTAALFLFMTCTIYLLLKKFQNVHGWLQFSYAVSLFFAFSFLAIVQMWSPEIHKISPDICRYLGWLIHLTFLSAFFWLTSMNFDLWWRFSGNRSLRRVRSKPYRESVKIFLLFASFSLGLPIIISGAAVAFDYYYRDRPTEAFIKLPSFGDKKCYFEDKTSQFPFLYGPVGLLLAINLMFFTSTVMHLRKIHSNTELARSHSTLEDKKGVRLIAKLFIVMGVLWIFEFISWAANILFPNSEVLLICLFMPTDILNSLQGIAIFVIFICKPNVLRQLKAKYQWTTEEKTHIQNSSSVKP